MKFKVSEELKEIIVKKINESSLVQKYEEDFEEDLTFSLTNEFKGKDEEYFEKIFKELKKESIEKIRQDIKNLKNNNIVSMQLLLLLEQYINMSLNDVEIQLSSEQIEELFRNIPEAEKDGLESIKNKIEKDKRISFFYLKRIYPISISNENIKLEPEMKEMTERCYGLHYNSGTISGNKTIETIRSGLIKYGMFFHLFDEFRDDLQDKKNDLLIELYYKGFISKEIFLKKLGETKFNYLYITRFNEKYGNLKMIAFRIRIGQIKRILSNLPKDISEKNRKKLKDLLEKIDEMSPEEIVKEFNAISNDEWKEYLKDGKGILFHATDAPIVGNFMDNIISTSLINANHQTLYRATNVGYKINPKFITNAYYKDSYIKNARRDEYSQYVYGVSDLPQNVSAEMQKHRTYSEVNATDFVFESVVVLKIDESTLGLAKKMAEAQNIPIDVFDGKTFLSFEEYSLNKTINDLRDNVAKLKQYTKEIQLLGLTDFDNNAVMLKKTIIDSLGIIEATKGKLSRKDMSEISRKIKEFGDFSRNYKSNQFRIK